MNITAKARASLGYVATTTLSTNQALDAIVNASSRVKGGGVSLLTTGLANAGAEMHVEQRAKNGLRLSITSGKRLIELMVVKALVTPGDGDIEIEISIERYKTQQQKLMYLIPVGPKQIYGMSMYKRFLEEVAAELKRLDPSIIALGETESEVAFDGIAY